MRTMNIPAVLMAATLAIGGAIAQTPAPIPRVPGGVITEDSRTPRPVNRPATIPRVSGGVMAGYNLTKVAPVYPAEVRQMHARGTVVLHAGIGNDGLVKQLTVISGSGLPPVATAVLDAVRKWTYKPYLLNGQTTAVDTTIAVSYNFIDQPPPGN